MIEQVDCSPRDNIFGDLLAFVLLRRPLFQTGGKGMAYLGLVRGTVSGYNVMLMLPWIQLL